MYFNGDANSYINDDSSEDKPQLTMNSLLFPRRRRKINHPNPGRKQYFFGIAEVVTATFHNHRPYSIFGTTEVTWTSIQNGVSFKLTVPESLSNSVTSPSFWSEGVAPNKRRTRKHYTKSSVSKISKCKDRRIASLNKTNVCDWVQVLICM